MLQAYFTHLERGSSGGKAFLQYLAKITVVNGSSKFEWIVLDWNETTIKFYQSLGSKPQNEWLSYQLTGHQLVTLAYS
jgi:hypothetical protein